MGMGAVVNFQKTVVTRALRLVDPGDQLVNNTSATILVKDRSGAMVAMLLPGQVFASKTPREVYFEADAHMVFRSYINEESPGEHVY